MKIPEAKGISPVSNEAFKQVFGQSNLIIIGSITAFFGSTVFRCYFLITLKKNRRQNVVVKKYRFHGFFSIN